MPRMRVVLFAIAIAMLALNLLGCSPKNRGSRFTTKLVADPGPEIEVGKSAKITVTSQNLPAGVTYRWLLDAGAGTCSPQESGEGATVYQAPTGIGDLSEKNIKLTVEFYLDGKKYEDSIDLTIKRRINAAASPPLPSSPQPTISVSPATPPKAAPKIEITHPGVFDPRGEKMADDMIEGKVSGIDPADHQVILYTLAGGQWFIQPYRDGEGRFTPIDGNLNFSNVYHVGVKYAALLCRRSWNNPPIQTQALPLSNQNVVAFSIVDGVQTKK